MAHEVETIAFAGEVPWHGLGHSVLGDLTPAQMQKKAGVDWKVEKIPLSYRHNGKKYKTDHSALVRETDSSMLSVISDDWEPLQNDRAFEFFHDFVMEGHMSMETAGSLKNGQIVWALAKINEGFTILGKDRIQPYLLFTNPHRYGKALDIRIQSIRVVCANTLQLALSTKADSIVRQNHRTEFDPELAKEMLGVATKKMEIYKENAEFLASKRFTTDLVQKYFSDLFPTTSKKNEEKISLPAKKIMECLETQPGAEMGQGSFWQLFNAVTYAVDHKLGRSNDTRLQSAWYGSGASKKHDALKLATEMAGAV